MVASGALTLRRDFKSDFQLYETSSNEMNNIYIFIDCGFFNEAEGVDTFLRILMRELYTNYYSK